jgi:uncharacterized protein with PQ loop repeat
MSVLYEDLRDVWPTFVISMLISRMVWLIAGSLINSFESFMISVDFCKDPVTFNMAITKC